MTARKVLHLIPTLAAGGAERQLVELVDHLDRRRWEPVVCTIYGSGDAPVEVRPRDALLHTLAKPLGLSGNVAALRRLRALVRRERPDVLHTWLNHANNYGRVAALVGGFPPVVTSVRIRVRGFWRPRDRLLERALWRRSAAIVANAEPVATELAGDLGIDPRRIRVIHNGVDTRRFRPASAREAAEARRSLGLAPDRPTVVMVARFAPQKGHDTLLEALARCADGKSPLPQVLCVGGGLEGPAGQAARAHARRLGLQDAVRFQGTLADVERAYRAADVAVLPSRHEGLPNAVLEAMASGLPVVASEPADPLRLLGGGRRGWVVPTDDAAGLAAALGEALALAPAERARVGAEARALVEARFSCGALAERTMALYDEVLGGPHA